MPDMPVQHVSAESEPYDRIFARLTAKGSPYEVEAGPGGLGRRFVQQPHYFGQLFPTLEAYGDRECLVYGDTRLSYTDFTGRVRRLAGGLSEVGGIGDRDAILGANHPGWIITFWGAVLAGMTPVALNGWWRGDELTHGINLTEARILIGDVKRLRKLPDPSALSGLDHIHVWDGDGQDLPVRARPLSDLLGTPLTDIPVLEESHPVAMMFTSGTTGRAKAAVLTHGGWIAGSMNAALASAIEVERLPHLVSAGGDVRLLASLPFFHVGGAQGAVIGGLAGGQTIVIPEGRFDAGNTLRLIERERIDRWSAVPAMVHGVCVHGNDGGHDLSSLKTLGYGAAPSHPNLRERAEELFPSLGAVSNAYGLTETGGIVAMNTGIDLAEHPDSVGRPFATAEIRIVNEAEEVLPSGIKGEVQVRGPFLMKGYFNDPEATARMISPDGWLRTGDLGRLDKDGFLYLLGRKKDIIIRGGENILAEEVEHCIEAHPDVNEVAVIAVESERLGEEIKAIVRLRSDGQLTETALQEWVAGSLSHFKVPSVVEFREEPLPRNAAGKLLKSFLRGSANSQFDEFFS